MTPEIAALSTDLLFLCRAAAVTVATAESCTGGLIIGALTEIPGSSDVIDRGFITYSNEAKTEMLGVSEMLIKEHGAVSEAVARAMVAGVFVAAPVRLAIAVTGVAGPSGGTPAKPVGRVHLAVGRRGHDIAHKQLDFGPLTRQEIRLGTVREALALACQMVSARALA